MAIDDIPVKRFVGQGKDAILWRIVRSEGEKIKMLVKRDGQEVILEPKPEIPGTAFYKRKATRQIGITPAVTPLVGKLEPGGAGEEAGLKVRDFITHANGEKLYSETGLSSAIAKAAGQPITLTVERDGQVLQLPFKPRPPVVAFLSNDSPAARAGLKPQDKILKMDEISPLSAVAITEYIAGRGNQSIAFIVEREGKKLDPIQVKPAENAEYKRPMIGASFDDADGIIPDLYGKGRTVHQPPLEQIQVSVGAIISTIDAVASSKSDVKLQHMGGPVMMMNVYYRLFQQDEGWKLALWFSVLLNVNLAMLNMLPLPVLDGGHITLAILESIRKKPVNIRLLEWVQTACALLIIGFMLFITFYDVQDVFGGGGSRNKFQYANPAEAGK
jgi:regulator of sigma E protease